MKGKNKKTERQIRFLMREDSPLSDYQREKLRYELRNKEVSVIHPKKKKQKFY